MHFIAKILKKFKKKSTKKSLFSDVIQDDVQSNDGVMVLLAQPKIRVFIIPFHKKTKERMVGPLSFNIIYVYLIIYLGNREQLVSKGLHPPFDAEMLIFRCRNVDYECRNVDHECRKNRFASNNKRKFPKNKNFSETNSEYSMV